MQHKGVIGFLFFYFLRIMISDFQVFFFFFPSLLYNFHLNCDARPMFCNLNFTCMLDGAVGSLKLIWMLEFRMLWVPWTLLGCCNSRCCGFCSLELTLSYMFNFCTFTTSSFANVALGFVFHIHFQSSNIYMQSFALWDTLGFSSIFFLNFLESVEICCWNWNLVLESFVEFEFQIQEILKFWL